MNIAPANNISRNTMSLPNTPASEPVVMRRKRRIVVVAPTPPARPAKPPVASKKAPTKAAAAKVQVAKAKTRAPRPRDRYRCEVEKGRPFLPVFTAQFPDLFTDPPKPLAIGVLQELKTLRASGQLQMGYQPMRRALDLWVGSVAYLRALAAGGARYGLDGKTSGEVSSEDAKRAALVLNAAEVGDKSREMPDKMILQRYWLARAEFKRAQSTAP